MKIPLFDIDWTLLAKDPKRNVHNEGFFVALEKVFGIKNAKHNIEEGRLDNRILIETAVLNGIPKGDAENKLGGLIRLTIEYFKEHKNETNVPVLPGVKDLLEELNERHIPLGLLTGNIESIAWDKLKIAGLDKYFKFGAFGDRGKKRVDLVYIARERASKALNREVQISEFVIIGDTTRDVECAKDAGIKCIGVASGPDYSMNDLKDAGADLVISSLEEKNLVLKFLGADSV